MALSVKTGVATSPTSPGNQTIAHGLGATPTLVMFWGSAKANASTAGNFWRQSIGAATSSTARGYSATVTAEGSTQEQHKQRTDKCFAYINNGSATLCEADFVSFDGTNITINWTTVFTSGLTFQWMAISGVDANVFNFDLSASTGSQNAAHGLGSTPKALLLIGARADTSTTTVANNSRLSYGAATASGQWASSVFGTYLANPSTDKSAFLTDACHCQVNGSGTVVSKASLTSMDATNVTLNVLTVEGAASKTLMGVAIGGAIDAAIGTETQKTSTGTKATTGLGLAPGFLLLGGNGATATGTKSNQDYLLSMVASTTNRFMVAGTTADNVADSAHATGRFTYDGRVAAFMTPTTVGSAPTVNAQADISSLDADGFTLNWTAADATARLFGYLALAASAGGALTTSLDAALLKQGVTRTASLDAALLRAGLLKTVSLDAALLRAAVAITAGVDAYLLGSFVPLGVEFDGTNDYMTRGAGLTGAVDSPDGLMSFWVNFNGGDAAIQRILLPGLVSNPSCIRNGSNKFKFLLTSNTAFESSNSYTASSGWVHVLAAWQTDFTAGNKILQLYINDTSDIANIIDADGSINVDYTQSNWSVGAASDGTLKLNGCLAEHYFGAGQSLDLSVTANRRKFIDATGAPVDLGSDGSIPTGVAPLIYQSYRSGGAVADFATNRGSGGNFTITGTLTECATAPALVTPTTYTLTAGLDAALRKQGTKTASLDAALKKFGLTVAASLDAALKRSGLSLTAGLDAAVFKRQVVTAALDVALRKNVSLTAGIDAVLTGDGSIAVQAAVDAALQRMGIAVTAGVDAALAKRYASTASLDAALLKVIAATAGVDAALVTPGQVAAAVDVALQRRYGLTASVDSFVTQPVGDRGAEPLYHGGRGFKVDQPGRSFATSGRRRGFTTIH